MTSRKNSSSAITAGYMPLDIVSYTGDAWHAAGGTAGNVAAILGFLGWRSNVVAEVGSDFAGRVWLRDMKKANVSVQDVRIRDDMATPRIVHEIDESGHRYRYSCPECRRRLPRSRPLTVAHAKATLQCATVPDVFFFDRVNAATLLLAEHFHANGSQVVFEPSRVGRRDYLQRALDVAHIVKYASDRSLEIEDLLPTRPRQVAIVTRGGHGAFFRVGKGAWHSSGAFSYPVIDAGGAGDWTTAGMLHALSQRDEGLGVRLVREMLRWGQALAAVSCGAPGARGLARQQSADSVLRAAQFMQHREGSTTGVPGHRQAAGTRIPRGDCPTCLEPQPQAMNRRASGD